MSNSSNTDGGTMMAPDGVVINLTTPYNSFDSMGVTVIVATAGISLFCVAILMGLLGISMWKKRSSPTEHFFVRTHAAAYFACLLVADMIQAIGTLMSARWIKDGGITLDSFCSTQGAIKNAGNLSISLWTLTLAIHTFCVLCLRWKPKDWVLYSTLAGVWLLVGFIVVIGPGAVQTAGRGPYFGISGYWCWISNPYPIERIVFEYMWMLGSAGVSFVLYTLTFFRLRGNIVVQDGKLKFRNIDSKNAWKYQAGRDSVDIQMTAVAKGMIGFPILFTIIVLPIAVCRFIAWSGKPVSIEATIFSDAVFSLTGVFDLILFTTTRSLLPARGMVPWWFYPRPKVSAEVMEHGVQPYNVQDFASAHGFNEMYQSQAERTMVTLPPRTSASLSRASPPSRPIRPLSLGNAAYLSSITIPPIPENDSVSHRSANRLTTKTLASRYSQDDANLEYQEPATAWDDIDLGRRVSPSRRDTFGGTTSPPPHRNQARDTQYTTFTLSAYESSDEVPPMPTGAGIDLSAGRNYDDDDDERSLVRSDSQGSSRSGNYDLPSQSIQPPKPVARRF